MSIQRIMGGPDLSKESSGPNMYTSRNTGLLSNRQESCHTLVAFLGKRQAYKTQSQVYFIYTASIGMV